MKIFESRDRADVGPAGHNESPFAYIDRVSGEPWESVRTLMDSWFDKVASYADKGDLRGRLRSDDRRQFDAAFWELYLHESLIRMGYTVQCHPHVDDSTRRPDFLATGKLSKFYLEARNIPVSDDEIREARRRNELIDSINKLKSSDFFIGLDFRQVGPKSLSGKTVRGNISRWLGTLTPESFYSLDLPLPSTLIKRDGWQIAVRAFPKSANARGKDHERIIGMITGGQAGLIKDRKSIIKAISDKDGAYGELHLPYIVAVSMSSWSVDDFDVTEALFGSDQVTIDGGDFESSSIRRVRAGDGYWHGRDSWLHPSTTAVVTAKEISPWSVASTVPTLWANPGSKHESPIMPAWEKMHVTNGCLKREPAKMPVHELFELSQDWPPDDAE